LIYFKRKKNQNISRNSKGKKRKEENPVQSGVGTEPINKGER
jgi:hypothetical protein